MWGGALFTVAKKNKKYKDRAMLSKIKTTIFVTGFLVFFVYTSSFAEMRSTNSEKVDLRTGPGESYSVKWEYGNGFPVKIVSKKGKWFKIQDFENDSGWINSSKLNKQPHAIVKVNKGKNKKISIRRGPGVKYDVIGQAYYGVVFEKQKQEKGWVKVKHESGLEGWIETSLLWGF
jgi:SH3-like domain-containing protein